MAQQYSQQQIDKALETLPEELNETMFSVETANHLADIYNKNGIIDNRAWQISEYVGHVLMGLLPAQEFEQTLVKDLKLPKKTAQEVAREINRFVFYPVRPALEKLHGAKTETTPRATTRKTKEKEEMVEEQPEEQAPEQPQGPDTYREPLE